MKSPLFLALLCFVGCLGLAGCGQKGPLYLPTDKPEQGTGVETGVEASKPAAPAAAETPADPF